MTLLVSLSGGGILIFFIGLVMLYSLLATTTTVGYAAIFGVIFSGLGISSLTQILVFTISNALRSGSSPPKDKLSEPASKSEKVSNEVELSATDQV